MTDIKAPSLQWKPALTDRGETATFSPTKIIEEGDTLYHDPNFDDNRMTTAKAALGMVQSLRRSGGDDSIYLIRKTQDDQGVRFVIAQYDVKGRDVDPDEITNAGQLQPGDLIVGQDGEIAQAFGFNRNRGLRALGGYANADAEGAKDFTEVKLRGISNIDRIGDRGAAASDAGDGVDVDKIKWNKLTHEPGNVASTDGAFDRGKMKLAGVSLSNRGNKA